MGQKGQAEECVDHFREGVIYAHHGVEDHGHHDKADQTDAAAAPTQGDGGTAGNFVRGVRESGSSAEINSGVWNENSCKSG